jgi:death-on-curing protein
VNVEFRSLSLQDVLIIHQDTIENDGGRAGVRDIGLVESAVVMPQQAIAGAYLHPDLAAMAAAYLTRIGPRRLASPQCTVRRA